MQTQGGPPAAGGMEKFEAVIGLEVHAQLKTFSKIFCGCSTQFGASPNQNTCAVCLGLPGALPVLNEKVVELALRAAIALNCNIPEKSVFARKNYFYPDLPKGYQISQYDQPLAINGHLQLRDDKQIREIRIRRIHMEEDAGKLIHEGSDSDASYVDFNRAGIPLIEIVTEPDLRTSREAYLYLKELKTILQFCDISEANMEEGNLRCDANISLRLKNSDSLGTRVEIKNLNSFKNVAKALDIEFERQKEILNTGNQVIQETRLFDADRQQTFSMRSKEEAEDYRYFPDPDLLPLSIETKELQTVRDRIPELPEAKRKRYREDFKLSDLDAAVLTEDRILAEFFENTARLSGNPKQSANWITQSMLEQLKREEDRLRNLHITPEHVASLIALLSNKTISSTQAKEVFVEMWNGGKMPAEIVAEKGMTQVSDHQTISLLIDQVFAESPDLVARYKGGETKLQGVLVGLVMKSSKGKANPGMVAQLIEERLKNQQ